MYTPAAPVFTPLVPIQHHSAPAAPQPAALRADSPLDRRQHGAHPRASPAVARRFHADPEGRHRADPEPGASLAGRSVAAAGDLIGPGWHSGCGMLRMLRFVTSR